MNYIGSSLFIINMDFNYKYYKDNEENKLNDILKIAGGKGITSKKSLEVKELILPPIK
jgi:hypothetical protein